MTRKALPVLALALVPLFAACAQVQPTTRAVPADLSTVTQAPAADPTSTELFWEEPGTDAILADPAGTPGPTATPAPTSATAAASARPTPRATRTARPTASARPTPTSTPTAKPTASPRTTKAAPPPPAPPVGVEMCVNQPVALKSAGDCVKRAQQLLASVKIYSGKVDGQAGQPTANAILNYQRSRGIRDNGVMTPETWQALASGRPALSKALPASCTGGGIVLCASKAHRELYFVRDGKVEKTVPVRFGGMTRDDNKNLRIFPTVNGRYTVYAKDASAFSDRWEARMPYSIKFDPNMYVHYSGDFASRGYAGSSHGCINVGTMANAKWLFDNTPVGAKVVVY